MTKAARRKTVEPRQEIMPYQFLFDSNHRILRCHFEGDITDPIITKFYEEASRYAAALDPVGAIIDFSEVGSFEVSPSIIRQLASLTPVMPNASAPRFIVSPSPKIFGLARMFQAEGQETRPNLHVVKTAESALAALGANNPRFEPIRIE